MATVPVKYFHSGMTGAPQLSGTAGALVSILDACLIDGFGLKSVDSLVVASNVATMTISTGHPYEVDSVVLVAGATPSSLNGEWRVTEIGTNTVKFATTGISDQTATGTITSKFAPLGWSKLSGSTSTITAYKSTNVASPGHYLRVDDTGTVEARTVGYETMSDINTGSAPFPTAAQQSGGLYWHKSSTADSVSRNWVVIGDDRLFYLWVVPRDATTVTSQGIVFAFGDFIPQGSTDLFNTVLMGKTQNSSSDQYPYCLFRSYQTETNSRQTVAPRSFNSIGAATQLATYSDATIFNGNASNSGFWGISYPNGPDNGLIVSKVVLTEGTFIRGRMPGAFHIPQQVSFTFNTKDKILGQGDLAGRKLLTVRYGFMGGGPNSTNGHYGVGLIDITGPWR